MYMCLDLQAVHVSRRNHMFVLSERDRRMIEGKRERPQGGESKGQCVCVCVSVCVCVCVCMCVCV